MIGGTVASAVIGGTVSELPGGKFANGAVTSAFAWAFSRAAGGEAANNSTGVETATYPLANEGPHVTLVCRGTWAVFSHCGTFVWNGTLLTAEGITRQFSLGGFKTTFVGLNAAGDPGEIGTFRTDMQGFLNPGGRNRHFSIAPPTGVSQAKFVQRVISFGNEYGASGGFEVSGYRLLFGPNSNSAAAFPIIRAGGNLPNVWNARALNYWKPKS